MKNKKGITLIGLVVTIIVLLILAGVTIATLTGDNGLLTKSTEAKKENLIGAEKEKIGLGFNEYRIKKYTDTNPSLTVEGATVTENGTDGWTIKFAEHEYTLSADGTTINGPIISSGGAQNEQLDERINDDEGRVLRKVRTIANTYMNLFGGQEQSTQFYNEWVNPMTQLDLNSDECNDLIGNLNSMEQMITGQNINSAEQFDGIMQQLLNMLNGTCQKYGFGWSRDNSTRMWTCHFI